MPTLRFLFDPISPYAYLAWQRVPDLAARHGRELAVEPVLFAALLNHHGHMGPAEIEPKRRYVFKDAWRTAHQLGVPLVPPPTHPFRSLLALRVLGLEMEPDTRIALTSALLNAVWAGGPGVEDPVVVDRIARELEIPDAAERASRPEAKERLRASTERAVAEGAWGVPTLIADGELFWGYDSLDHLDRFLAGEDPLPTDALARWANLPSSAKR